MKKLIFAALSLFFLVGCSDSENDTSEALTSDNIIGSWVIKMYNNKLNQTDDYFVCKFNADNTQEYVALSVDSTSTTIVHKLGVNYTVENSIIHLTNEVDDIKLKGSLSYGELDGESGTILSYYEISNIQDNEDAYNSRTYTAIKCDVDYSSSILGDWTATQNLDDSDEPFENIQMDFTAEGQFGFKYLNTETNTWVEIDDNNGSYTVLSNMLYTQWNEDGVIKAEAWEISVDGNIMTWKANRGDSNSNAGFTLTRHIK